MRFLLTLGLFVALVVLAWHAAFVGTDQSRILGAPQIETIVDAEVKAALDGPDFDRVTVKTDGRNVTLSGRITSEKMRKDILAAASEARLLGQLSDEMQVLTTAAPFTFMASKNRDGAIALKGYIPGRKVEDALLAEARTIAGGAPVSADLTLAAGAPDGDWQGMATSGLLALSKMTTGTLEMSDQTVLLSGEVPDQAALDAIGAMANVAPMGDWTLNVGGAPPEDGFLFGAMKTADGDLFIEGHVPDADTKEELLSLVEELSGKPPTGDLQVATGMPDQAWPDRVKQGLRALLITESGMLSVNGREVSLSGDVMSDAERAALDPLVGDTWSTEIKVLNPTPSGDVTVLLRTDGTTKAVGTLPKGLQKAAMFAALPGVDVADLLESEETLPQDWAEPLEGLAIVLPRFQTAEARIFGNSLSINGLLKRGFSAAGSEASLRTVLDRSWNLDVELEEMAPLAGVIISKRDDQVSLSGVLPQGLAPEEVLGVFGDSAGGDGLTAGGEGDADAWLKGLKALGEGFTLFDAASAEVTIGSIDLDGVLSPGYAPEATKAWINDKLGDEWSLEFAADPTEANDGDQRANLETGQTENFQRGYWLPEVDFPVSVARCREEVDTALGAEKINFLTGSAEIDQKGRLLLNRLAAVSLRCLNSAVLRLEIGGHTDSAGNDGFNQRLSEKRAAAVAQAMLDRGVNADAMQAKGYGEAQPIASNDTIAGRAENRRITFEWFENDG